MGDNYIKVNKEKFNSIINLISELDINKTLVDEELKVKNYDAINELLEKDRRNIKNMQEILSKIKLCCIEELFNLIKNYTDIPNIELITKGGELEIDFSMIEVLEPLALNIIKATREVDENKTDVIEIKLLATESGSNILLKIGTSTDTLTANIDIDVINSKLKDYLSYCYVEEDSIVICIKSNSTIINTLVVGVVNQKYPIPLLNVDTIINYNSKDIRISEGNKYINYRDKLIKVISLSEILNINSNEKSKKCIVVINSDNLTCGLIVDKLYGQANIVIKTLPLVLRQRKEYLGTTILGNGKPALVINPDEIIRIREVI